VLTRAGLFKTVAWELISCVFDYSCRRDRCKSRSEWLGHAVVNEFAEVAQRVLIPLKTCGYQK
jgi:hypothetical protein